MKNIQYTAQKIKLYVLILVGFSVLSVNSTNAQSVYDNSKLRFGSGSEASINNTGNLQQPFYYNAVQALWRKLTFSSFSLDNAFALGGVKTDEWNVNGNIIQNPVLSNQTLDVSGYVSTGINRGYGTIISTGNTTVNGQLMEVRNTYILPQSSAYIKVTSRVRNVSSTLMENVRIWIGTRDDWVGATDSPNKQKGNLVNGAFVQVPNATTRSSAVQITSGSEGVLFYTNSTKGNTVINSCCSFINVINQNPLTSTTNITNDGSYAFYVRLNDLPVGATDEFSWYYAAGEIGNLPDIIADVAAVSGAVNNISYAAAEFRATTTISSTGYWLVAPRNSVVPTPAQIKLGVNYGSVTIASSGSGAMVANVEKTFNLTGLTQNSLYDLYFVSQENINQVFSSVLAAPFATLAAPPATALNFDGQNDFVTIPHSADLNSVNLTVEAWIKTSNQSASNGSTNFSRGIVNKYFSASGNGYNVFIDGGKVYAWYFGVTSNVFDSNNNFSSTTNVADNNWHRVTFTVDNSGGKIYIDGVLESSRGWSGAPSAASTTQPLSIGIYPTSTNLIPLNQTIFDGSIDEVRVWNRALCLGEIQNNIRELYLPQTGLLAYYKLNQGFVNANNSSITTLTDLSGNNRTGTLSGFALSGSTSNWVEGIVTGTSAAFSIPAPTITANGPTTFCPSGSVVLTASSGVSYLWSNGATSQSINATAAGNYSVTVTNASGCSATANATSIVIQDLVNPTITLNGSTSVTHTAFTPYVDLGAVATDNCLATLATTGVVNANIPATYTLTYTATDASGNSTIATRTIIVQDVIPPVAIAKNIIAQLNASGNVTITPSQVDNGSSDNSGGFTLSFASPDLVETFNNSTYSNKLQAVGTNNWLSGQAGTNGLNGQLVIKKTASGRTYIATTAADYITKDFVMTVVYSNTNVVSGGDILSFVGIGNPFITDGNSEPSTAIFLRQHNNANFGADGVMSRLNNTNRLYNQGITRIGEGLNRIRITKTGNILTFLLDRGNTGTFTSTATFDVSSATANQLTASNSYLFFGSGSTNFMVNSFEVSGGNGTPGVYSCANIGPNNVVLNVTDPSGNSSSTAAIITVVDQIAPSIVLNGAASITHTAFTPYLDLGAVATDNCSATLVTTGTVNTDIPATYTITYTATDASGNATTATRTVVVRDVTAPVVITKNITVALDATGNVSTTPAQVDNGSSDNSGTINLSLDKTTFNCSNLGPNPVTLSAIDPSGNTNITTPAGVIGSWNFGSANPLKDLTGNWGDLIISGTASISNGFLDVNTGNSMARTSSYTGATIRSKTLISYVSLDDINARAGSALTIDRINSDVFDGIIYAEGQPNRWMNGSSNALRYQVLNPGFAETAPNQLVQVALTYEEKPSNQVLISFYRNGVFYGSYTSNNFATWSAGDAEMIFGARHFANGSQIGSMDAKIQKAMIFNRALTQLEIQNLYSSTSNAIVTVVDQIAPIIVSKPVSVTLTSNGTVSITPQQVIQSGTDNCSGTITYTLSQSTFGATDAINSPVTIQLTGTDASGNATTVPVQVTVIDPVPVVFTQNITIQLGANGQATITPSQVDNGSSSVVGLALEGGLALSKSTFDCTNLGTNTVTLTATSSLGSTASATAVVTVIDNIAPIVIVLNRTIQLNATGNATITAADINNGSTDNCSIASITLSKTAFDCTNVGANTVTLTVTDVNGNVSSATAVVTVEDNIAPIVFTQNRTIQLNATGNATITGADINNGSTDNCGIATIVLSKTSFDCTNVGANTVTLTVTDVNGNVSTATAIVTVEDNIAPIVIVQNRTIQLNTTGNATITAADINNGSTDNCSIASIALSKTAFDCTNVGANTVTLTVTDVNGNVSTATAVVTVEDNTAPIVFTQNKTIQLNATGNATITAADINNGSTDNCSIASITLSKTAFDCTNVGANTVTLTVTDIHGNVSTATAVVTVGDNIAPIVFTQNRTIQLNATGNATITAAEINNGSTDNCSIASITLSKTAFDCTNVGANTVTLTVTDIHGNVSTATAVVTVEDNIAPIVFTQNRTIQLNAAGTATITAAEINNGSTDNCSIASIALSKTAFDCTNVGANTVTLTVTDVNGNVSTATAVVTVEDKIAPIVFTQNRTIQLNAAGTATITAAEINNGSTDNCSIASIALSKTAFDCTNVGANTVTLTVTDIHGNVSTATAVVTVEDNIAPIVFTQNRTIQLNATGNATITAADINNGSTDNCSIASNTLSKTAFDCTNVGANTVTLTVTDVNGNVSTATAVVTVEDKIAPIVITQNLTIPLSGGTATITAAQLNNGSTDNCGIASMTIDKTSFDCGKIGNHTVTLTVTDIHGNVASKTATVTIVGELTSSSIASIPTSSTFTGGVSTNLYLGYGAQSTTLQVSNMVVGGNGTNPRFYTYVWTGSASSQLSSTTSMSPVFTPTAGGYYTFNVLVTNKYGCTTSATISICVKDIREVDKKGKFTGKVFICHAPPGNPSNNNTLSISVNAVASHLSQHSEDRLGSCSDAPCAAPSNMMMSNNSTDGAATKEGKIELSLQNTELVAYPNPFSQNTTVSFKLPYTEEVAVLEMYDMRGVKIQSLFNGSANANQTYEVKFNGQEISAGSYTFRLITSKEVKIFKVVMSTN